MKINKCEKCSDKRYCSYCGKPMILTLKVHTNYDTVTGKKVQGHYHILRCPDSRGLGIFRHDRTDDMPSADF